MEHGAWSLEKMEKMESWSVTVGIINWNRFARPIEAEIERAVSTLI